MSRGAYRQEHPLPAVVLHWLHLVCMVLLTATGFFIATPLRVPGMTMAAAQWLHYVLMYLVLITLAARVYWAFYGSGSSTTRGSRTVERDFRNFAPQAANRGQLLETLKYYLFLRRTRPVTAKYDTLEKGAYVFWAVLLLLQAYSGFALYGPTYNWAVLSTGTALVGGLGAMRTLHYLIMWVFIVTVVGHVYFTAAENADSPPLMFWWREKPADDAARLPSEGSDS